MASETACVRENILPTPANEPTLSWRKLTRQHRLCARAVSQASDSMPITVVGARATAPVVLGSMPMTMMVDTGCTDRHYQSHQPLLIAWSLAVKRRLGEDVQYTMADGSNHTRNGPLASPPSPLVAILLHNVTAGIGPDSAPLLLGFTDTSAKYRAQVRNISLRRWRADL